MRKFILGMKSGLASSFRRCAVALVALSICGGGVGVASAATIFDDLEDLNARVETVSLDTLTDRFTSNAKASSGRSHKKGRGSHAKARKSSRPHARHGGHGHTGRK